MFNWAYDISTWNLGFLFSFGSVAVMWLGIVFIKPIFRLLFARQTDINSIVATTVSAFSVFYGLLLGLISVATYQNYSNLSDNVTKETSVIASLNRNFSAYDPPKREALQAAMTAYVRATVEQDWPEQRRGVTPSHGSDAVTKLFGELVTYEPSRISQQILHAQALREFSAFVETRRTRLANVNSGIPGVLWYVVLVGAGLNILCFWFLDMRFIAHLILGGVIAFFLGVMIFIIVALDMPFRGEVSVHADPFKAVYDTPMASKPALN